MDVLAGRKEGPVKAPESAIRPFESNPDLHKVRGVDAGYSHSLVCVEDDTELSIGGPKVLAYILSTWTPDTATKGAMSPRKTRIVCRISKEHLSYVRA